MDKKPIVSVVLPCLNEEAAIGVCIDNIKRMFSRAAIEGEIIVVDNGSTDKSAEIALKRGAMVINQPLRGYGYAYLKGFQAAQGDYFIMADADGSYDFNLIPQFLSKLTSKEYDFVTGSRFLFDAGSANMAFSHRFIGNPVLTAILNYMFNVKYSDVYCGYRGFSRQAYELTKPISVGMEFNLELAINAWHAGLRICEIPIILLPRIGDSKLRAFKDAWRSLRMMLLYCPNKVFLFPGFLFLITGITTQSVVLLGLIKIQGRRAGIVSSIFGSLFSIIGFQILSLGLFAKTYSWSRRFDRHNELLVKFYRYFKLEAGLLFGALLLIVGLSSFIGIILEWIWSNLSPLPRPEWAVAAATLVIIGIGIIFSSIFISAMSIQEKNEGI